MLTGLELKVQRVIKDIKVKQVAEFIGVHYTYICKMEKEVQAIPQHIYKKWVEYLGLNEEAECKDELLVK